VALPVRWHNRRWRHDHVAALQRALPLKVASLEVKSLRSKVVSAQSAKRRWRSFSRHTTSSPDRKGKRPPREEEPG